MNVFGSCDTLHSSSVPVITNHRRGIACESLVSSKASSKSVEWVQILQVHESDVPKCFKQMLYSMVRDCHQHIPPCRNKKGEGSKYVLLHRKQVQILPISSKESVQTWTFEGGRLLRVLEWPISIKSFLHTILITIISRRPINKVTKQGPIMKSCTLQLHRFPSSMWRARTQGLNEAEKERGFECKRPYWCWFDGELSLLLTTATRA